MCMKPNQSINQPINQLVFFFLILISSFHRGSIPMNCKIKQNNKVFQAMSVDLFCSYAISTLMIVDAVRIAIELFEQGMLNIQILSIFL